MSEVAAEPTRSRIASSAALTAAAQISSMLIGGLLAVGITLKFGANAQTDGVFAAYGVYGIVLLIAQSVRTTVVARLVEGESVFAQLDRFLAAGVLVSLACGIPFALLGGPVASLLTGGLGAEAGDTAAKALLILWPGAAAQVAAALFAATLGTRGEFGLPGLAYVVGGIASIVVLLVLAGPLGVDAVAVGVTVGSVLIAAILLVRLLRVGYRPSPSRLLDGRAAAVAAWQTTVGALGFVVAQVSYVLSVAFAARLGEGAVTLYSYAFFACSLVVGATTGPVGIVLAAPLARTWDRRPASLEPHLLAVLRAALVLVVPAIGLAGLIGVPLVDLVLGRSLGPDDPATLMATFLALGGLLLSSCASPVPTLAAFAAGRYLAVLAVAGLGLAVHAGISFAALQADSLPVLGAATSVSTLLSLALLLLIVYGPRGTLATLWLVAREAVRVVAVGTVAFLPVALGAWALGAAGWHVLGAVLGLAAFALLVRLALPEHRALVARLAEPLTQRLRTSRNIPQA